MDVELHRNVVDFSGMMVQAAPEGRGKDVGPVRRTSVCFFGVAEQPGFDFFGGLVDSSTWMSCAQQLKLNL